MRRCYHLILFLATMILIIIGIAADGKLINFSKDDYDDTGDDDNADEIIRNSKQIEL